MKLKEIIELLDAKILCGDNLELEIATACGSDLMSDVLAYVKDRGMLLTGLLNPQAVRTAEMLDLRCICFVRGKSPGQDILKLAKERDIAVLSSGHTMFTACGKLFSAGVVGSATPGGTKAWF
jgi:predicted transcriptional regulator